MAETEMGHLTLERRPVEVIVLTLPDGRLVRLVLLGVDRPEGHERRVRLGVEAPRDVPVGRPDRRKKED